MTKHYYILYFLTVLLFSSCATKQEKPTSTNSNWPDITNTTKPWTRWWWMGSAVDKPNIKQNLIDLHRVGIGGVEIAPIYGVKDEEDNFIDYLSPKWMEMLDYTIHITDSLNMQVDLTLGTGWPYGGPQVIPEFAATKLISQTYTVKKGNTINLDIAVTSLKEKQPAKLLYVLAYDESGNYLDLTPLLKNNNLNWSPTDSNYTIYAIFEGKTGQKVKRAAPGGSGFTLDHYATEALNAYVKPFDTALVGFNGKIRSIFNDSFEVYGTDFTPNFFKTFKDLRGYDLKPFLPQLLKEENDTIGNRIKSDYRETLSDLLLNNFDAPWTEWAHSKNFKSRLQAHGSPGNLIDLYASADIPECETFGSMPYDIPGLRRDKNDIRTGDADPVMLKFSSSAAHISGKTLTSSETFTWLRDHFKVALSQCKPEVEDLFLNGVNHVFLHGTTYSPKRADWPGWKFYASTNFNPNLTIGEDESELFSYIANCQSMLQAGTPDNETLLYWPIYDVWDDYLKGTLFFQFKIHSLDEWLHNTPFYNTTTSLMDKGYAVDFISDNFIEKTTFSDGKIRVPGGSYKSLVIPHCDNMPLKTLEKLLDLKQQGASIIFENRPKSVPGYNNLETQNEALANLTKNITPTENLFSDLNKATIAPETLVKTGLKYIKRDLNGEKIYYLVNHTANSISTFIPINVEGKDVILFDPLTRDFGKALTKTENGKTLVKVNIAPGKSYFLKTETQSTVKDWDYFSAESTAQPLTGPWHISFKNGGPELPNPITLDTLKSWTALGKTYEDFSGTAKYEITFDNPDNSVTHWQLQLGDVRESAKVWLNDTLVGSTWSLPFTLNIGTLKKGKNMLRIEVTNLSANRIRAKELRGEEWKNFYEINMVDKDYQKFDATKWQPMPSGLLGPITLTPLKLITHEK
ncbi:glycosyl hydrolase [Formosa sp. 4Alg 33]|uniref:glycosyl hydrolase n=1 Tax=Formosa sp. 4Alg 33 TaxID=3382189 RepID=UPI003D9C34FC